ncbi:hydrophobic surface binding protein A-domain-containing protein [Geopyxis carbonaria]|nr:hydrophobic surface binding protein A-domain-containing protein [Geopyxis carbonaria]
MQLTALLPALLATLATATINTDITTLYYAIGNYTGTLTQALTVLSASTALDTAIDTATASTTSSAAFSATDSTAVTSAFTALTPRIKNVLTALVAKEPTFDASGLDPTVLGQINTLKSDSAAFATALGGKVVAGDKAAVASSASTAAGYMESAVAAFS